LSSITSPSRWSSPGRSHRSSSTPRLKKNVVLNGRTSTADRTLVYSAHAPRVQAASNVPNQNGLCLPVVKHTAGTWVNPMRPRARDTLHRLKRLWIICDRRLIGPCLRLPTSVGTAVKELGHDVITFGLAQLVLRQVAVCPNGYGAMNGHAETNLHTATCVTCRILGASDCLSRMR
jgi:hypothetical protein